MASRKQFNTEEAKQKFIEHVEYLLLLSHNGRSKRSDWQNLKKLLGRAGYWRRKKPERSKRSYNTKGLKPKVSV
jgi:hypothetical protein